MKDELNEIIEQEHPLLSVRHGMLSDHLVGDVVMAFASAMELRIFADQDTDQIVVEMMQFGTSGGRDVSTTSLWCKAIGRPIFAAWDLVNYNGYHDGLQLEFGSTVTDEHTIIQLVVVGSCLQLSSVQPRKA
jgi:hypothetical protein